MLGKFAGRFKSGAKKKERKPVTGMIPLFSWRSIIILGLGLIVGAGLGMGYWIMSPSLAAAPSTGTSKAFLESLGQAADTGPWSSKVHVQVVNPGFSYMSLRELADKAQYYAAKANSLPFLEFLGQELAKKAPQYQHSIDELEQMVTIQYDLEQELPTIEIKATTPNIEETAFLAGFIPGVFQNFLVAEEKTKRDTEYQNTFKEMERVKIAILEAEKELRASPENTEVRDAPAYIALSAKIKALESELTRQAGVLAVITAEGYLDKDNEIQSQEYRRALEVEAANITGSLAEAGKHLNDITVQRATSDVSNSAAYVMLKAKIGALEAELNRQAGVLAGMTATGAPGALYVDAQAAFNRTSTALSDARKELATLEAQAAIAQQAIDAEYSSAKAQGDSLNKKLTSVKDKLSALDSPGEVGYAEPQTAFTRTSTALANARKELAVLEAQATENQQIGYQVAKANVDNLNKQLSRLNEKLSTTLAQSAGISEVIDYLAAGKSSLPMPELPERIKIRSALMMGAVLGMGVGWAIMNFRWLTKAMSAPSNEEDEEEEEEEA